MKKVSLILAIAMVVAMVASICASATWEGELSAEQREFEIPKKPENRTITIDGKVDLEGEWYGAFHGGIDLNDEENADYYGVWDATVWGNSEMDYPITTYDEIEDKYRLTWDTYFMWDEAGLYFAIVCANDQTYSILDVDNFQSRIDGWTPMIRPVDDNEVGYNWLNFWCDTVTGEGYWNDDNAVYSSRSTDCPYTIICANDRSVTPDENGLYPWYAEGLISWEALCYDASGNKFYEDMPATIPAGYSFQLGNIFMETAGETYTDDAGNLIRQNYIRAFDCKGWNNFDIYTLNANPAADNPNAPVAEEPAVEEPAVEEPAVELVETVEEPAEEEPAPAPAAPVTTTKAPATADVSVLFYALAAVSAVGGISVFKRK